MTAVPLVDLAWQRDAIAADVEAGWARVLATTGFVGGPEVAAFERAYAAAAGVGHCIGVANGTDGVELALRALDLRPGAVVALPANTFVATASAVLRAGLSLRLVDVYDETLLWDSATCDDAGVDAFVPVHLYGRLAPMAEVLALADGRAVVEDAAQSHGAVLPPAARGRLAATSFYPGKNLGAYGDAGAVLTDDPDLAHRVRLLANHGSQTRYHHEQYGVNSRLDALQAVVLGAKLTRLAAWNALRTEAAARYDALLGDLPAVRRPELAPEHAWHLYVVRVPHRDEVQAGLQAQGIGAGIHYPAPVHQLPPYSGLGLGSFPVAERAAGEVLSLPLFPGITPTQQERVVSVLRVLMR